MPFEIIRNDITKLQVDAIVNAANNSLCRGGGVCGAIFAAAGEGNLQRACDKIGGCETGKAVITKGYALPAKYIIHTVGPVWQGGANGECDLLYACYKSSLELAKAHRLESVAFPLISSGIYGYPKDRALRVATNAIGDFLLQNDMSVSLVIFDKAAYTLGEKLYSSIKAFIDDDYAGSYMERRRPLQERVCMPSPQVDMLPCAAATAQRRSLDDWLNNMEEGFSRHLLRLIDEKQRTDAEVYKRANIDRRLFSKIRSNKDYKPSKNTALALAVALELSLDDTRDLLMKAGYALSRSNKLDAIVEYFITNNNYNIFEINEALFAFDQSLLGA
ncbi:MAG: macro domain-containing protein [Clostridiales bacterium]|nr:macro domain-containing protein [Clostridiales bacterium]